MTDKIPVYTLKILLGKREQYSTESYELDEILQRVKNYVSFAREFDMCKEAISFIIKVYFEESENGCDG